MSEEAVALIAHILYFLFETILDCALLGHDQFLRIGETDLD